MKARVKATGEIVNVYNWGDPKFRADNGEVYDRCNLDFDVEDKDNPDYWEKLKHQYAGMAMQGMMSNEYTHKLYLDNKNYQNGLLHDSIQIATALVEKLKIE